MSSLKQRRSAKQVNRNTWTDYPRLKWRSKSYERVQFSFTFVDGEVVGVTHQSDKRKAHNWGPAYRIACAFWAQRKAAAEANARGLYQGEQRVRFCEHWERTHKAPKMLHRSAALE
jgi:hypothetical protein